LCGYSVVWTVGHEHAWSPLHRECANLLQAECHARLVWVLPNCLALSQISCYGADGKLCNTHLSPVVTWSHCWPSVTLLCQRPVSSKQLPICHYCIHLGHNCALEAPCATGSPSNCAAGQAGGKFAVHTGSCRTTW
jgi:hypothetical protein